MSCKPHRRVPQCARCRSHNTFSSVRGHKRVCEWKDCTCSKCKMVTEKRRITAVRVACLRRERKRRMPRGLNMENFQLGTTPASAWGMMGNMSGSYASEQFMDRRMFLPNDAFRSDMFHMAYPTMFPYNNDGYQSHTGLLPLCEQPKDDETSKKKDVEISKNMANFQHEYESFMRQQSENNEENGDVPLGNETTKQASSHSVPGLCSQRIFVPPTTSAFYINGPSVTHADPYQASVSQPRFLPVMLNAPLSLPCSYPITPRHAIPYRVGF